MSNLTIEDVLRMIRAIQSLYDEMGRILNALNHEPQPGSQAEAELSGFQEPERVQDVYIQANLLIEGVADHLMAFTKTVTQPAATIAPWTCVRGALESGALAAWLIDSAVDVTVRVQRSFAFRYEGLDQQVKCVRAFGLDSDLQRAKDRIDEVERDALRLGYAQVTNKKGDRTGIGQNMPSVTEIIGATLNAEGPYRLASAMAHGHNWAISQLGFRRADDGDRLLLEKHLNPISVAYLCVGGANAFAKPVWQKFRLFGWDTKDLEGVFNAVFADLRSRWSAP
jgi:hypothetical protein